VLRVFRTSFEVVKEGRIFQTETFQDLYDIAFWQALNVDNFWTGMPSS
jgi:hypothetical protein